LSRRRPASEAWRFEQATVAELRARRWLRLHVLLLGGVSLGVCWAVSRGLDAVGVDSLAWRPLLALWVSYPLYLGLLALWARWLLSRETGDGGDIDAGDLVDAADQLIDAPGSVFRAGGGGDFGGGGASGDFDGALDAADEGIVVVVPLMVVVAVAVAMAVGLGLLVFGLFGVEVLLGVAVEIAFASVGSALAWRAQREGWLSHALRRTFWPMLGLSAVIAAAGWALHHWLPQAHTVPQALRLLWP
jgi:hypothetical protein